MDTSTQIKEEVKNRYAAIARKSSVSCCQPQSDISCNSDDPMDYSIVGDTYKNVEGYVPDADLGLGCGLPTEFAGIKPSDTVVDLGSGAGNDVFVARSIVGEDGHVLGIDMTEDMISLATKNNAKLGFNNVEFKLGEIENLPIGEKIADVVISNCVLNLVPDKKKAFREIHRTLKTGGHFCISDMVLHGAFPEKLKESVALYAGCVSGALQEQAYLDIVKEVGFTNIQVAQRKEINIPDSLLEEYLSEQEILQLHKSSVALFSITVTAEK